jgi:hypothetical protein
MSFGTTAHGTTIRAQAMAMDAGHRAIVRDVLAAEDFWGQGRVDGESAVRHRAGPQFPGELPAGRCSWRRAADHERHHHRHRLRGRVQLGLTAPIITQPRKGVHYNNITCGPPPTSSPVGDNPHQNPTKSKEFQ